MIIRPNADRKIRFLLVALSCLVAAPRLLAYNAIYAFGDSLTDTGNDPAPATNYFQGRYSNGALWIESLSPRLGLTYNPASNFAESGGETSDALAQVQQFIAPTNAAQALFVVWAGGNDFIHNFTQGINDGFWSTLISQSVGNVSNSVVQLYARGARTVMVPNQVDLSRIPLVLNSGYPAFVFTYLSNQVSQFNAQLASAITAIATAQPDLQLIRPDVHTRFGTVLGNLAADGFTKANPDALNDPALSDKSFDGPGQDYLFWDEIHPTAKAHALVAQWFFEALPRPVLAITVAGGSVELNLRQLQAGQVYTVQAGSDLSGWSDLATVSATNSVQQWSAPISPSSPVFFRLKL